MSCQPVTLLISNIAWGFVWQRHQTIASLFATNHEVIFCEVPGIRRVVWRDLGRVLRRFWSLRSASVSGEPIPARLRVVRPFLLPATNQLFNAINARLLRAWIRRETAFTAGVDLIWNYSASRSARWLIENIPHHQLIYDCTDDWLAVRGIPQCLPDDERDLLARADLTLVPSRALACRKSGFARHLKRVPHGALVERFLVPTKPAPALRELSVLYYGHLHSQHLDFAAIEAIARARPSWKIVLVGPVKTSHVFPPNVRLAGQQVHTALREFVTQADVLLLPYVLNTYTEAVLPAKIYECLATGRPIVAAPLPELVADFAAYIRFAESSEAWPEIIEQAVQRDTPELAAARLNLARQNSWESRYAQIQELLASLPASTSRLITRSTPLLSIVIVAYKSRDEIAGCLASIPQHLPEGTVEIVVVDNFPSDGVGEIVRSGFPEVKYLAPEKNLGFGRANNLGYAQTDPASELVLFLNPDTVVNESALIHCVARLRADRAIGLISPRLVLADGSMDLACRRSIPTLWDGFCRASGLAAAFPRVAAFAGYNLTHLATKGTYEVGAINGAFMLGRRDVFESVAERGTEGDGFGANDGNEADAASRDRESAGLPRRPAEPGLLAMTDNAAWRGAKGDASGTNEGKGMDAASRDLEPDGLPRRPAEPGLLAMTDQGEATCARDESRLNTASRDGESAGLPRKSAEPDPLAMTDGKEGVCATGRHGVAQIFDERFFMYGDDLDLCIRVRRAGWKIVYDGSVSITHLKGLSVAKDYSAMSAAIFDANREVYLKHFNPRGSSLVRWKYRLAFGAWKRIALLRAKSKGYRGVRPA